MHGNNSIECVFVYGTLKRGQCRERSWPRLPLSIEPAWTLGRLFDLGPYPALVEGADRVAGELWRFAEAEMEVTLRVLDRIEEFRNEPGDLYRRVVVGCTTAAGEGERAHAYRYARQLPADARLITANASGCCQWP